MSYIMLFDDMMIISDKELVYAMWYAALFWLPVRLIFGLIDHHRIITGHTGPITVGNTSGYAIGMEVEPPM